MSDPNAAGEGEPLMDNAEKMSEKSNKKSEKSQKNDEENAPAAAAAGGEEEADEPKEEPKPEDPEMCCCCICRCSDEATKKLTCCGCLPIKCGIVLIGIFYIFCALLTTCELFWTLLNEYIHWWYFLVGFILMLPWIIGCFFIITFFTADTKTTRALLWSAITQAMVSIFLVGIWNVIYFYYWYKENFVYAGMDVVGYTLQTKKAFIVWSLFLAFAFDFLYAYFQCVAILYKTTKDGPDPPSKGFGFGSLNPIGGDDKSKEDEDKAKADEDKKK